VSENDRGEEDDSFWEEGSFVETLGSADFKRKERTFHMRHDEEMNFECRKCGRKISAHNKDWHAGMCDSCFNKAVYGR